MSNGLVDQVRLATLPEGIGPYLVGDQFSSGRSFRWTAPRRCMDRLSLLESLVEGKRVIHLGFADHLEVIPGKRADGSWLHERLMARSERCAGVDLNQTTVDWIRSELGIKDVYVCDLLAEGLPGELQDESWDLVVMGELIEHLPDPIGFLSAIRRAVPNAALLVTAPNAWNIEVVRRVLARSEVINTDHQTWYSPFTLAKQLTRAGYQVNGWAPCTSFHLPARRIVARTVARCFPLMRPGLVMLASEAVPGG